MYDTFNFYRQIWQFTKRKYQKYRDGWKITYDPSQTRYKYIIFRHCFGPPISGFPPIFHEFPTPLRSVQIC